MGLIPKADFSGHNKGLSHHRHHHHRNHHHHPPPQSQPPSSFQHCALRWMQSLCLCFSNPLLCSSCLLDTHSRPFAISDVRCHTTDFQPATRRPTRIDTLSAVVRHLVGRCGPEGIETTVESLLILTDNTISFVRWPYSSLHDRYKMPATRVPRIS